MKKTAITLAALTFGIGTVLAGPAPVVSTGKSTPPPPLMDPCAGAISYNNVELLYAYTDIDGRYDRGSESANGVRLAVEYSPMSNLYFTLGAEYNDFDSGSTWMLQGGIGGYIKLTDNIDLASDIGLAWGEAEADIYVPDVIGDGGDYYSETNDDWGWYARPHLRAKFGCLTIKVGAEYYDFDLNASDSNGKWYFVTNLYYQVAPNWDLTGGVRAGEDATQWTGGVRWRY